MLVLPHALALALAATGTVARGQPAAGDAPELTGTRTLHDEPARAKDAALERARADAARMRRAVEAAAGRRDTLLERLDALAREAALAAAGERRAELEAAREEQGAKVARSRADALGRRLVSARARAALVLEALHRGSDEPAWWTLAFGGAGEADAASVLLRRQALEGRELDALRREAASRAVEAERRAAAARAWRAEGSAQARRATAGRSAVAAELARLRGDRDRLAELERDIESSAAGLLTWPADRDNPTIAPSASAAFPGLSGKKGQLAWPVAERTSVRERFGSVVDPIRQVRTFRHGVVLDAPSGTPVRALGPGRVVYAGWYKGFGRTVVTDHGAGDLAVLARLDDLRVSAGQDVAGLDVIGLVAPGGEGLYLQISHQGVAVDPLAWLR